MIFILVEPYGCNFFGGLSTTHMQEPGCQPSPCAVVAVTRVTNPSHAKITDKSCK